MDHDLVRDDYASSDSSDDEIYDEETVEDEGESELVLVPSRTHTKVRLNWPYIAKYLAY